MIDADDPRIWMAAERTLLAWIRTGLAVMALGFVLARHEEPRLVALGLGGGLVLAGSAVLGLAARAYAGFFRGLDPIDAPGRQLAALAIWFAAGLAVVGLILAASIAFPPSVPGPR